MYRALFSGIYFVSLVPVLFQCKKKKKEELTASVWREGEGVLWVMHAWWWFWWRRRKERCSGGGRCKGVVGDGRGGSATQFYTS